MQFYSMSLFKNTDEKIKTINSSWGHCLWSVHSLSISVRVFFVDSGFLQHPRALHCLQCPTYVSVRHVMGPAMEGCPVQGWACLCPQLLGWAPDPCRPELE